MSMVGNWILGAVMGVLSLVGLFLASRAHDGAFYGFGLLVFAFGIAVIFALIMRATAQPPRRDELGPAAEP